MKRQFTVVVDVPSDDEQVHAATLMRLAFFMIQDHKDHPEAQVQFKDTIDNENNPDD